MKRYYIQNEHGELYLGNSKIAKEDSSLSSWSKTFVSYTLFETKEEAQKVIDIKCLKNCKIQKLKKD